MNLQMKRFDMPSLGIFMSHPIQYQVSLLREISSQNLVDMEVNFYWDFGINESYDREFKSRIKWDIPLLNGYTYKFHKNYAWNKSTSFFGCTNPSVILPIFSKRYDVVLIYGWGLLSNWLVIFACLITGTKIMMSSESPVSHEKTKRGLKARLRKILLSRIFNRVNAFLYIGEENRRFYKYFDVPDSKLFFVPYAVDNRRHQDSRISQRSSTAENRIVILFVGKLFVKKRPFDLLNAYELALKKVKKKSSLDLELWFVGDGEQREALESFCKFHSLSGVKFFGFKNQTELPQFYQSADIFVLPSGYGETWGLVVNEAMCHGLPILVSDRVGCGLDLVTSKNGFIFKYGDSSDLAEKIVTLVLDEELRVKFGEQSIKVVAEYSQEIAASNIVSVVHRISG
jgi:glycosyltransferase involved in cell wall biosynthesis